MLAAKAPIFYMFPWRKGKEKLMAVHGASQTCGFSWGLGTCEGVLQENLIKLMISSDSPSREPTSTWRFPKSWVLLRFKNTWGCTLKHLSCAQTLEWSSLKNPWVHGVFEKNWEGHTHALRVILPEENPQEHESTHTLA